MASCLSDYSWALSSANIPLDSPLYLYLEKLAGLGLVTSDVMGIKPFSKTEAARLLLEAEKTLNDRGDDTLTFPRQLIIRLRELIPRETFLLEHPDKKPQFVDFNPTASIRKRYVYLDGIPRDYNRTSFDSGHQSAFGFIGGDLRPFTPGPQKTSGTEGTPLLENNNGTIHPSGHSAELRWAAEGYLSTKVTGLVEPAILISKTNTKLSLNRGYIKLGGGGLELEVGRDENWFGPGFRGTTTLTNNAQNFDFVKLSSPEPINVAWLKRWIGDVKYSLIVSRFDEIDAGTSDHRRPYFIGFKLAVKPKDWYEIGANFVRQTGGPGFSGSPSIIGTVFGGGNNDHANTIAGLDLRFRIPWLRNTEIYGEFSGEDNAGGVWPIVESYVGGIFIPCLTASCRDDFRFEYFFGSVMLYSDWQFPRGYVYHDMTPGHSQGGGGVQDFFLRYSHWFSVRNNLALEYLYTERGRSYRMPGQVMESKHAGRIFWSLPVRGDIDAQIGYGFEKINNLNLINGVDRTNHLLKLELRYRY
ncbi:MAG: capsule assembly Wzi family protein [Desulfuromonadales bacterium]|nr:capsule assembly Wzi family protein [Desulfuromonadales bacterium]